MSNLIHFESKRPSANCRRLHKTHIENVFVHHIPQVQILTTFTNNNDPIVGATLVAQLVNESGEETTITLFDDGNHEDGQVNDGTYGNVLAYLAPDTYVIRVQAQSNGITRLTSTVVKVPFYQAFLPILVKQ